MTIDRVDWDSDFFGYEIGILQNIEQLRNINFDELINTATKRKVKLLYFFSNQEQETNFASSDAITIKLADKKVTYYQRLDPKIKPNIDPSIARYEKDYVEPTLLQIALQSGIYSRFSTDPNFRHNEFTKLYTEWIKNSVNGKIAKETWVSYSDEQINGLITLGIKNNIVDIGLLAVSEGSRGKNVGGKLVDAALNRAIEWNFNEIQVVTQLENANACRFYEKCGFTQNDIKYIYHIWINL